MVNRFKSNFSSKQSWIKKNGLKVAEKGMEIAQQAVVYAGLSIDPQTAAVALQEMSQPSFEQLAEVNEISKRENKGKISNRFKNVKQSKSSKVPSKNRMKNSPSQKLNKTKVKKDNRIEKHKRAQFKLNLQKRKK